MECSIVIIHDLWFVLEVHSFNFLLCMRLPVLHAQEFWEFWSIMERAEPFMKSVGGQQVPAASAKEVTE